MTKIQLRRDTAANWTTNNPTPASGEPCYETDTGKFKIGDGVTTYNNLPYQGGGGSGGATIDDSTTATTSVWSSSKTNTEITTAVDTINSTKNDNIFDIGKFTVVGSPTITDDGIASGFSNSNYLQINNIYSLFGNKSWKINFKGSLSKGKSPMHLIGTSWSGADPIAIARWGANGSNAVFVNIKGTQGPIINQYTFAATDTDLLEGYIEFTGTKYIFYCTKNNDVNNPIIKEVDSSDTLTLNTPSGSNLVICRLNTDGSIDLKQFSITVDGKEVFNGLMNSTKPIYDAIKANNTELSEFKTETSTDFSAVNSALNEKANLTDLALKQNTLVSGTNIKTINGETILGEGDITVGGGGSAPTNTVTVDTDQTITGKKVFLQPNSANKGLNVALGSDATNPDISVHIGKGSNSDFTGGMIRFDSTNPTIVGLQQQNSGGTMKISSSGDLINYATGTTEIRNGATWGTSKSGIRIPANSKSNPNVEIVGGSNTVGSSSRVDAKISVGFEGTGTWAERKGVFIETRATTNAGDSGAKLWLGEPNIRSAIYPVMNATVGRCLNFETYVGDNSNATLSIQKSDVVYTDKDGVAHSLISGNGVNTDLSNLSDTGKNNLVDNNCYDFDNPTNITVGASGTSYTMPVTGLLYIQGATTSSSGYIGYKLPDENFNNTRTPLSSGATLAVTLRVKKGQKIIVQYGEANNMKVLVYPCFPGIK